MKEIKLTKGFVALVDDDDFERVSKWKWTYSHGYAIRTERFGPRKEGKYHRVYLHRFILNTPRNLVTDHINGNKLDCRKENLRACTQAQNCLNSKPRKNKKWSKFKGVVFHPQTEKWRAQITLNYKRFDLGLFLTEKAAALAYREVAQQLHKEFFTERSG